MEWPFESRNPFVSVELPHFIAVFKSSLYLRWILIFCSTFQPASFCSIRRDTGVSSIGVTNAQEGLQDLL